MYTETITFENFDGESTIERLHFNITKTELADNLALKGEVDRIDKMLGGEERQLTEEEIGLLLELVKKLMRMSYGVRSDDGRRFIKNEQVWTEFTQTMAYDTYLFSLFEDPEKAVKWMVAILPKDLREAAEKIAADVGVIQPYEPPTDVPLPDSDEPYSPFKDPKNPTKEELLAAMREKNQQS